MFGFPYSTQLPMPRIYCCFIHFISFFIISPLNEVEWVYTGFTMLVCPSVDRIVSGVYLPQYWPHSFHIYTAYQQTSESVLWFECCETFQNLNFRNFFKFAHFTLSCVHVMWKVKSWFLIRVVNATTFNFPWWYLYSVGGLINIRTAFGQNCNFVFMAIFFFQSYLFT